MIQAFQKKHISPKDFQSQLLKIGAIFLILDGVVLTFSPAVRMRSFLSELKWAHWAGIVVSIAAFYFIDKQLKKHSIQLDPYLVPIAGLLSGWGLLSIWRVTQRFGIRQTIWVGLAALIFIFGLRLSSDLSILRKYKYLWLLGGLGVTTLTIFFGTNPMGFGPRLWLGCCGVYFQPSEPLKLLLVVYLAAYLADRQPLNTNLASLLTPTVIMTGITLAILVVQRDLGTASIFIFIYMGIIFIATGKKRILLISAILLLASSVGGYYLFDVIRLRVDAWINPWLDPSGRSYQIVQSLMAQAAGGIGGRGLGLGNPGLVPVAHSDFIFSTISEEYGLAGTIGLILLIVLLMIRGFRIGIRATSHYHRYLAIGISIFLASQSLYIIGGNIRLFPLTGITLPFVSYGGSSLVTSFLAILILTHINHHSSDHHPISISPAQIIWVSGILIIGFISAILVNSWWAVIRGPDLLTRTDNARRTISDRHVQRGSIIDRNGVVLSESTGNIGDFQRFYHFDSLSPVIGYTHPFYGQAGAEASLDEILRGIENQNPWAIWFNHLLYGQPPPGLDVQISIDIEKQERAKELMGDIPGAVALISVESGQIEVMYSNPTYDVNRLEEIWEGLIENEDSPLLNRVTQGSYPTGKALAPFILSETTTGMINANQLNLFDDLGFFSSPKVRLPIASQELDENAHYEDLRLSPLQLAVGAAMLNNEGKYTSPIFLISTQNADGNWDESPKIDDTVLVFEQFTVDETIGIFKDENLSIWKHVSVAITDEGEAITWFIGGDLPGSEENFVVVVVLEEKNKSLASQIGQLMLLEK